jgi:Tfp pilus assembly protein PilP
MKAITFMAFLLLWVSPALLAQTQEPEEVPEVETAEPITGGVKYEPKREIGEGELREPFKSPFEIAAEKEQAEKGDGGPTFDGENRLEYPISSLSLRGIYLQALTGYWAIFEVQGEFKWFQVGTRFSDGDLVGISDTEVIFKEMMDAEENAAVQFREVVKQLKHGEE